MEHANNIGRVPTYSKTPKTNQTGKSTGTPPNTTSLTGLFNADGRSTATTTTTTTTTTTSTNPKGKNSKIKKPELETFATCNKSLDDIRLMSKGGAAELFFELIQNESKKHPKFTEKILDTAICAIENMNKQANGKPPAKLDDEETKKIYQSLYSQLTESENPGRELLMNICKSDGWFNSMSNEAKAIKNGLEKLLCIINVNMTT